ncbi:Endonuclease/exonuclease/phosphatase family protein [Pelomyxa schiedti]|nr:Endonuclease/exonuclease/phosphatase family protein [Pelomyxa schiedti]
MSAVANSRVRFLVSLRTQLGETHFADIRDRLVASAATPEDAATMEAALASAPVPPTPMGAFNDFSAASTLVVMPPPALWKPIVDIKKNHMNPKIKRPPYPHVTLLAPFVPYGRVGPAADILRAHMSRIQPFKVKIDEIKLFNNKGSSTMFLDPITDPPGQLDVLFKICSEAFPDWHGTPFEPHIGIGYFKEKAEAEALAKKYQDAWVPMEFMVQEIYINTRVAEDTPWEVRRVIPLGTTKTTPHFEEKPETP